MSIDACKRSERFNRTTGVSGFIVKGQRMGGNHHPDRCICQTTSFGNETTPHKHYRDHPHSCARCGECKAYEPEVQLAEHAPKGQRVIHPPQTPSS